MRRLLVIAAVVLLMVVIGGAGVVLHARRDPTPILSSIVGPRRDVRAPVGQRIRVQVLNTTKTRGLARRATRVLRDRGFDVVEMGTSSPTIDTTVVLDLSGHPEWANTVAAIIAPARVKARRDTSRYLDVTVLIGSTWSAPPETLYP